MRTLAGLFGLILIAALGGMIVVYGVVQHYGSDLPDYIQLADYQPPTTTRLHAGDGRLLAEFATENRVFVPIEVIPGRVTNAFLSAEDKGFYKHAGVDFFAVARAMMTNITNFGKGKRLVGASTITQQVAKNFLLTNEVSYKRKIKEAILAFRMERAFDKDRILELYMNEIFLGFRSYGVAAAALNYFNKSLDELSIAEAAYLAALPKAPNNYHPTRKREAALARRNWVISRLRAEGHITAEEAETAQAEPLQVRARNNIEAVDATFFAEEVRRELGQIYGEDQLYQGGLSVRTTLDPGLQKIAEKSLRDGLIAYDRRHGWRGPLTTFDLEDPAGWVAQLAAFETPVDARDWVPAVVLALEGKTAQIGFADEQQGVIPFAEAAWAQKWLKGQRYGAKPKKISDVLAPGDVVLVEPVSENAKGKAYEAGTFGLRQIPDVNGALVALDPHTGRVLAMVGGYSYARSEFNRATQALRQPGSSFKPIVYLAGLDSGFTPATIIMDGPIVIEQGAGLGKWKPSNYSDKFYGPTAMRVGIEKSRNLMTVRLAQVVGMAKIAEYAARFGVMDNMEQVLAMSLGAGETTLIRLTNAYAMMVNGGKRITPTLVDRVQDREGKTVFRHDARACGACRDVAWNGQPAPLLPDEREQLADPHSAYQIVSMMRGAVQRGTGRRAASLGRPLGGKTGTTNDNRDTWFIGFSPDLVVGTFVGFDEPKSLGKKETGSSAALPIFKSFMEEALKETPIVPFRTPPGLSIVRMSWETGRIARAGDQKVYQEAFKPGTEPTGRMQVIDGFSASEAASGTSFGGTGLASPALQGGTIEEDSGESTGGLY